MSSQGTIKKVLIVDDHPLVREGLIRVVEKQNDLEVCAEAEDFLEALDKIESHQPDVVIVDISLRSSNGLDLIKSIRNRWCNLPVLVVSMHDESLYAERAIRAGARGYIMKQEPLRQVVAAIRRVLEGGIYVSQSLNEKMLLSLAGASSETTSSPINDLSDREFEVFRLVGQGLRPRQIAEQLNLSVPTVESYRTKIRAKLKLKSAAELSQFAIQWLHAGQNR
jgi:DNA-binding NarL/FixJ family response regulator